ncbi:hypothetical protein ACEPAI_2769 [Sanghuangporus weigelae]
MKLLVSSSAIALAFASGAVARTFTVTNSCSFTIWYLFTDLNVAPNVPDQPTGWEAPAGSSVSFSVPDNWKAGRIWGRRNCDFITNPGPTSCATGGCNGGLLCDSHTGTVGCSDLANARMARNAESKSLPVTVAEWTLQSDENKDFYDVSLVDGFDLPMSITNTVRCPVASCGADLAAKCPDPLKGPSNSTGSPLGCKSACFANLDGKPQDSANCCTGSHNTAATCPPSGVQFYDYFKGNCPNAYAYAFDEGSGTALWTCDSSLNADYTLTFCP